MAVNSKETRKQLNDVIFSGAAGRIEGRFHVADADDAPGAIILHSHPMFGGSMNEALVYDLFNLFADRGFTVLRFNMRGIGRSQGEFDHGHGELSDAAAAMDWMQSMRPNAPRFWVAGVSFGAWIGMQLLMRRPELAGFISVAPPANLYDFSFLAPCPSSGLVVYGDADKVAPAIETERMVERTRVQKGVVIEQAVIEGANHYFEGKEKPLMETVGEYVDRGLRGELPQPEKTSGR